MFMGLMKYYRQTYQDLMTKVFPAWQSAAQSPDTQVKNLDAALLSLFIERVFDRVEIAFCAEWSRAETVNSAIDELQAANRQITNEKNMFLTIFESLPIAVFLLDDNRRIQHMNQVGAQMLDPSATSGGHYYSSPEGRIPFQWFAEELSRLRDTGEDQELESVLALAEGQDCRVLAHLSPMQDISSKYPGTVVILKDITERTRTETELKQVQAHLIQQEKMASIGQLAAGVAHEINNPMGFISSNLTTLKKYVDRMAQYMVESDRHISRGDEKEFAALQALGKKLKINYITEDVEQLINESQEGAERVRHIVQGLKSFSRLEQADCTEIDLNETLETTINIAWNEIKYVASLERDFGELPLLKCYPQQLNQVFLNLLVNAAQAIEEKGVITIRTWSDKRSVYVSVSDSGRGIPAENLKRIFEPFFTTKEVGKGTGLGLSISYGIIKNHNGTLEVQSEPGKGSTFSVAIPLDANL
jgi:signal transduction histidine kinase